MGRLTEAIIWYNMEQQPTGLWIRNHFRYFTPTIEDERARKAYQAWLQEQRGLMIVERASKRKRNVQTDPRIKDLFDS